MRSAFVLARPALIAMVTALVAALAAPAAADAHGIHESAAGKSPPEFVWLGVKHMLAGYDHLLFIAGVVLLAGAPRRAAKLISLFVAGHSITLLVATLAGWKLNATAVDVVIALSVVYVGVQGLRGRPADWRAAGAIVFGFGLVHGLGLSTRLQDLGLPEDGLVWRILAFNLGVEIGQLIALGAIVGVGALVVRWARAPMALQRPAFWSLVATGLLVAAVLSFPGQEVNESAAGGDGTAVAGSRCTESRAEATGAPALGGGHPAKPFYGPDEPPPVADMAHVVGDGYVIVTYRASVAEEEVSALSDWVHGAPDFVVGAVGDHRASVVATTAQRRLTCSAIDTDALTVFRDRWFDDIRSRRALG